MDSNNSEACQGAENQMNTPPEKSKRTFAPSQKRQTNIELLRIVAMFLVMVVHADFWANGAPTQEECLTRAVPSITRFFIEAASIVCVDVFVLISGWFGIRPNVRKMSSFLFQCFFFLGGLYVVSLIGGWETLKFSGIMGCFGLLEWNWFIKAYIGLCIFAPFLNRFIDSSDEKQLRVVIFWFYLFQMLYGWLFPAAKFIEQGYSVFSFVGLYLLAQYIRRYLLKQIDATGECVFILIYVLVVVLNTIWGYISIAKGLPFYHCVFNYTSPLVIIASISLMLTFYKMKFQSRFVNWLAASSFAVFLFHGAPALNMVFFKNSCIGIYNHYDGIMCLLYMFLFLIAVFVAAVLLDQLRIAAWCKLSGIVFK